MTRLVLCFCMLLGLWQHGLQAQESRATLKGRLEDPTGEAVIAATLVLESGSTSQKFGCISQDNGRFSLEQIPLGAYRLTVRSVGYKPINKDLILSSDSTLSPLVMEVDEKALPELEVIASHTRIKTNGSISVRMQGNSIAKGKSLMELLRFVRGVEVYNNSLLINGKAGSLFFVGDRQISLQELQSIPPSMIKSIEVEPNAGVSYGKDATGGVITIVLRDEVGALGSLDLSAQADRYGFVDALLGSAVQYQKGKFTLYNNLKSGLGVYRSRYEREDILSSLLKISKLSDDKKERVLLDNLGLKYQIDPRQYVSLYGGITLSNSDIKQENRTDGITKLMTDSKSNMRELNVGVFYRRGLSLGEGSSFSAKMEYLNRKSNQESKYLLRLEDQSLLDQSMGYLHLEPRLDLSFKNGATLKAGFLFNHLTDDNTMHGMINPFLPEMKARDFSLSGQDYSPWIEYGKLWGKSLYLQAGLRYQATLMRYDDKLYPQANYNIAQRGLYPNVQLQYMIDPKRNSGISLAYRHDFSLPNYGYYSPIAVYQTEYLYSIGNQQLKKESFDRIELNYYLNKHWTLTYRMLTGSDIIHILTQPEANNPELYYSKPENVGSLFENYLSASYTHQPLTGWHTNNRLFVRNNNESMPGKTIRATSIGWSTTHQVRLAKNMGLSFSFAGETARKRLSYVVGSTYSVDAGSYLQLLNERMYINLSLANILHSKNELKIAGPHTVMRRIDLSPQTRLKLSVSWSFSSGDQIKRSSSNAVVAPKRESPKL